MAKKSLNLLTPVRVDVLSNMRNGVPLIKKDFLWYLGDKQLKLSVVRGMLNDGLIAYINEDTGSECELTELGQTVSLKLTTPKRSDKPGHASFSIYMITADEDEMDRRRRVESLAILCEPFGGTHAAIRALADGKLKLVSTEE